MTVLKANKFAKLEENYIFLSGIFEKLVNNNDNNNNLFEQIKSLL